MEPTVRKLGTPMAKADAAVSVTSSKDITCEIEKNDTIDQIIVLNSN